MPRRFLSALLAVFAAGASLPFLTSAAPPPPDALAWPAVRAETRPWTRWWWFGNIADPAAITSEMEKYAAAGLGGLELTPIYGVRGAEDRFTPYLSPAWMQLLDHTLAEARRLGLGLDLANGTGWPFGGPWLADADAAHTLAHRTYTVAPGAALTEPVAFEQAGLVRVAGPRRVALAELRRPVTANPDLQDLALDQVRFTQPLPLVALTAFAAPGEPVDLTARVDRNGRLDWTAPADRGTWTLYALFSGQHGKMVERAAPGGEGYALDHLSADALRHYLAKFDAAFAGHDLRGLRAFFNDSYEVDDSQGESDFTPRFFDEFQQRRGYDLRLHLPELFAGADTGVLSDYRETVSDLLLDRFTVPWRQWANDRGALIRNQAHNAPANVLDLYAASDIPEQEGNGFLAMKLASSAAHVTGKPLASAETATWLNEHFLTTLAQLKQNVDDFLLAGLNHNCYHGTAFSPPDAPWPGFQFYAAVELSPANPFWADFAALNAYVTRAQSFLQSGRPDEDVLLYYNIHDRWAVRGNGALPHFGHGGRDPVGVSAGAVAATLHAAGVGFDYISDRQLQDVLYRGKMIESGRLGYHAIVLPEVSVMPAATLAKLVALAEHGATILVHRHLPAKPPGLARTRAEQEFAHTLQALQQNASTADGITTARVGRGQFLIGDDLAALLARRPGLPRETLGALGLEFIRRRDDTGPFYFVVNRGPRPVDGWVAFHHLGAHAALFDPMTGALGLAASRPGAAAGTEIYLQLAPGESLIVRACDASVAGPLWKYWQPAGPPAPVSGAWSVTFTRGGPTLPAPATLAVLKSWTDFGGDDVTAFSGTATYTLTLPRPRHPADAWRLDLGAIADSARIRLNGRELAVLLQPPWRVDLPASALGATNTLEIEVTNLAANRIADLDRRGVPWKHFYNVNFPAQRRENAGPDGLFTAARWSPRPSGLLGPVTLTPLHAGPIP